LQNAGVAGDTRLAGVGPRSATTKSVAVTQVAESIVAAPLGIAISVEATPPVNEAHFKEGSLPRAMEGGCVAKWVQPLRTMTTLSERQGIFRKSFFITSFCIQIPAIYGSQA
jgi:hypothetical protein